MEIQFILNDVDSKWNNYRRYLKPIFMKTFELTKQSNLESSVTIILVNDGEMRKINNQYRKIDNPTDVLTFVDDEDPSYLGDVFINVNALSRQALEYGHSLKREFCFLVAHGSLHLLGYDHQTKKEEEIMFSLQEEILCDIAPKNKK